jgi:hypothetical protein
MTQPITDQQLVLLRRRLDELVDRALGSDEETRRGCAARLRDELAEWEEQVKGRTTVRTLTDQQIRALRATMPFRGILLDAALDGNEKARAQCAWWIAEREEAAEQSKSAQRSS